MLVFLPLTRLHLTSFAGMLSQNPQLRPTVGFEYELGGGAAIWAGNHLNLRHQFRISRGLAIEVHLHPDHSQPFLTFE